ncbi:hypothetical protein AB0M95_13465 [Sphaerisporangium sp. NPDC051017]
MAKNKDDKTPKHAGSQKQDKPLKVERPGKETGDGAAKGGRHGK